MKKFLKMSLLLFFISAGLSCKKEQPKLSKEEALWQQLQNDSIFITLSNINFISAKEDYLIKQKAGNDSLYRAAIKSVYQAKTDSVINLVAILKSKYIGFSTEYVKKARLLRATQSGHEISFDQKKKMSYSPYDRNDPDNATTLDQVEITSNCALSYRRFDGVLTLLKNVYDLNMSFCGEEDFYLKLIYERLSTRYQPNYYISRALIDIGRNYNQLKLTGQCAPIWGLINNTEGSISDFENYFSPFAYDINNDMTGIIQSMIENCNANNSSENDYWRNRYYSPTVGSGSAGSYNIPDDPYMPGQDNVAIDPKKYTKCFESIPNAGATYKVIVQVQEPAPGTSFNWAPSNGVGHTAITLIKQGSNGMRVAQTLGFYPADNKISGPSKMVDNSDQTDYTIRMEINMGGNFTDFKKNLSGIESPPSTYELLGMNCTAFVVGVCSLGGITLPNAITTVGLSGPGGATMAMTPGGLGYSMRAAHAKGDSRVASGPTSTGSNPASNGPCN
jgi:hypothetical protein